MPYTDDPEHVPADAVRFLLGDTNPNAPLLSDNEVEYLMDLYPTSTVSAAARGAEILASKNISEAESRQVGPLRIEFSKRGERYTALAKSLWARVAVTISAPFAGGISRADKLMRQSDPDRVQPAFTRRMMAYPNSGTEQTTEDLLSPPEVLP